MSRSILKWVLLSDSTIRRIHSMLHLAMKDAGRVHIIARNPTEGTTVPKQNGGTKQVLNDRALDAFLTAIEEDEIWHDFFYTELTTGLRRGEICGLMWQDFDEKNNTLKVSHTLHNNKPFKNLYARTMFGPIFHQLSDIISLTLRGPMVFHRCLLKGGLNTISNAVGNGRLCGAYIGTGSRTDQLSLCLNMY